MKNTVSIDSWCALECPTCGYAHLHQELVEAIFRDEEDGPGTLTAANSIMVTTIRIKATAIHFRREATYIRFTCEHCADSFVLAIKQYKGATIMSWLTTAERAEELGAEG